MGDHANFAQEEPQSLQCLTMTWPFVLCVGEGLVSRPHLLGENAQVIYYLTSWKLKDRRNCLKVMMNEKKKLKMLKSERTLNSCMHGDDHGMEWGAHANILSQSAMCKRWVWQHRTDNEDCNTTRTLMCSCCASCWFSGSWFSRCHWCRTPQRPARWFHSTTAFHHANATPNAKFFPSGCCSPIVSCHRPRNLYPKFLHISHRENGLLRCCLYTPHRLQ